MNSADSVVARLKILPSGDVGVDLPPAAVAMLRHNYKDKFYFQVITDEGKLVDGDTDLPLPTVEQLKSMRLPRYMDMRIHNERVRTLLMMSSVEQNPSTQVYIQCGETLESRSTLIRHILLGTVSSQLLVIVFGATAVWFGVTQGLSRLAVLQAQIAQRSQTDLSSINEGAAPLEVRPLVHAINNLLAVLKDDLEAKQRFVSNAAHQLRTPLAGLKTYVGILKKMVNEPAVSEVVAQLDAGTDKTTHMVNRLLALAKVEPNAGAALNHKVLDLNHLVSEAATLLVVTAVAKNIELSFDPSENTALISGDEASLQELATNIIENAILYTPEGGSVRVSVLSVETISLIVEDNGPGIPPEERERVFERFYRILGTGVSGTGLGLAIVNEIARTHNARVLLDAGLDGKGTKVKVEFMPIEKATQLTSRLEQKSQSNSEPS